MKSVFWSSLLRSMSCNKHWRLCYFGIIHLFPMSCATSGFLGVGLKTVHAPCSFCFSSLQRATWVSCVLSYIEYNCSGSALSLSHLGNGGESSVPHPSNSPRWVFHRSGIPPVQRRQKCTGTRPDHSQCHRSPPRCTARSFPHKLEYKELVVDELEQRPLVISKVFDIFAAGDELKLQKHTVRTTGTDLCFMWSQKRKNNLFIRDAKKVWHA